MKMLVGHGRTMQVIQVMDQKNAHGSVSLSLSLSPPLYLFLSIYVSVSLSPLALSLSLFLSFSLCRALTVFILATSPTFQVILVDLIHCPCLSCLGWIGWRLRNH